MMMMMTISVVLIPLAVWTPLVPNILRNYERTLSAFKKRDSHFSFFSFFSQSVGRMPEIDPLNQSSSPITIRCCVPSASEHTLVPLQQERITFSSSSVVV